MTTTEKQYNGTTLLLSANYANTKTDKESLHDSNSDNNTVRRLQQQW